MKWSPVYLSEVKHFNIKGTAWAYTIYELAAVPGTLLCGWVSDKVFKGKRGLTGFIFMILTTAAVVAYWMNQLHQKLSLQTTQLGMKTHIN